MKIISMYYSHSHFCKKVRAKARNAAVALERLLEERFSEPDALGGVTSWPHEMKSLRILDDRAKVKAIGCYLDRFWNLNMEDVICFNEVILPSVEHVHDCSHLVVSAHALQSQDSCLVFPSPLLAAAAGTTYQEAANILGDEEALICIFGWGELSSEHIAQVYPPEHLLHMYS